ncbi:hypothetical protein AO895_30595 [Pseudomonas aeruginosa]|nr:hypothetical protein AO894_30330 [Pseudomonas aeruginosa]OPD70891.1 hypothetical protein AO895_30595 [Pseudomonas aeruginosa]OPD70942.1 hypothetical protein AO897_32615 [Pseudomonas aeruginosa]
MHEVRLALQVVGRQTRPVRRPSGIVAEGDEWQDAGASLLVPFGRLQKALAWEGETRGQGRHRKQLDHQT